MTRRFYFKPWQVCISIIFYYSVTISVISKGEDPNDKETWEQPPVPDYMAALRTNALNGSRIGVLKLSDIPIPRVHAMMLPGQTRTPKEVYDRLSWASHVIEDLGATVLDPVDMSEQDLKAWSYFLSPANKINRVSSSASSRSRLIKGHCRVFQALIHSRHVSLR